MFARLPLLRLLLLACAVALPASSRANGGDSPVSLDWRCVQEFDEHYHVLCRPQAEIAAESAADALARRAATTAPPSRAPDPRPVAQRGEAEVFSAEAWRVPLHAPPSDSAHVVELLDSVLCGRRARCTIHYATAPVRTARR